MPSAGKSRISLVVLSYNRAQRLLETLAHATALPEKPPVIVVDNGSRDGSAELVTSRFPEVEVIALRRNYGAAARNVGVRHARTPFVAFSDDDTYWLPGSLERARELLESYPRIGVLNARVLVGPEQLEDKTCRRMAESPLPTQGLPGPALTGFLAGATVFRRCAFLRAGGYEPRFFIGAVEGLLALDVMTLGFAIVYAPALVVRHFPANLDRGARGTLVARNDLWTAWLRRAPRVAAQQTLAFTANAASTARPLHAVFDALRGLPWALRNRRVVPRRVEALCKLVDDRLERDAAAEYSRILRDAERANRARSSIR